MYVDFFRAGKKLRKPFRYNRFKRTFSPSSYQFRLEKKQTKNNSRAKCGSVVSERIADVEAITNAWLSKKASSACADAILLGKANFGKEKKLYDFIVNANSLSGMFHALTKNRNNIKTTGTQEHAHRKRNRRDVDSEWPPESQNGVARNLTESTAMTPSRASMLLIDMLSNGRFPTDSEQKRKADLSEQEKNDHKSPRLDSAGVVSLETYTELQMRHNIEAGCVASVGRDTSQFSDLLLQNQRYQFPHDETTVNNDDAKSFVVKTTNLEEALDGHFRYSLIYDETTHIGDMPSPNGEMERVGDIRRSSLTEEMMNDLNKAFSDRLAETEDIIPTIQENLSDCNDMSQCVSGRTSCQDGEWDGTTPENDTLFPGQNGLSQRIVFNSKPTAGQASSKMPVFVCSDALLNKKDTLHFGELKIGAADFNVNAVCNKTPHWSENETDKQTTSKSGDKEKEDVIDEKRTIFDRFRDVQFGDLWFGTCQTVKNSGERFLQQAKSCNAGKADPLTTALVMGAVGLVLSLATGIFMSLFGLVLEITLHAAVLTFVVVMTAGAIQAKDTTPQQQLQNGWQSFRRSFTELLKHLRAAYSDHENTIYEDKSLETIPSVATEFGIPKFNDSGFDEKDSAALPLTATGTGGADTTMDSNQKRIDGDVVCSTNGFDASVTTILREERDVSTMTEENISEAPLQLSSTETMTDPTFTDCTAVQTDPIACDPDAIVNYIPVNDDGTAMASARDSDVCTKSTGSQVNIDAKAIHEQAELVQQKHQQRLRRMHKKFLAIRRNFQKDGNSMKCFNEKKGGILTKLQLTLPALQREKNRLMAEKFMVERQYTDQKKKNQELVGRITRLNKQYEMLGQTQHPVFPPQRQLHSINAPYNGQQLGKGAHSDSQKQQQQQQQPASHFQLGQPPIPPAVAANANKWMTSLQQFQPPGNTVTQSSSLPHQQARLPIFKLLHSAKPPPGMTEELKKQQHQQQNHQQQSHISITQQQQQQSQPANENFPVTNIMSQPLASLLSFQQADKMATSQSD